MNPLNPYGDGNVPNSQDDIGITLRKILAETIAGNPFVSTAPTHSAIAGQVGQFSVSPGFFYFYDGTHWLRIAGSTF